MSQGDIIKLLKKNPDRWFSAFEIKKKVGNTVVEGLKKLRRWNEVKFKSGNALNVNCHRQIYYYQYKDD